MPAIVIEEAEQFILHDAIENFGMPDLTEVGRVSFLFFRTRRMAMTAILRVASCSHREIQWKKSPVKRDGTLRSRFTVASRFTIG